MSEPLTGLDEAVEAAAIYAAGGDGVWGRMREEIRSEYLDHVRANVVVAYEIIAAAVRADERAKVDDWADLAYDAWCVIANSGAFGNPPDPSEGFPEAAVRWRDRYHAMLAEARPQRCLS